ncbi:MAG TPA: glycosyl transferase, family 2, partial [Bacteroidia bacterium]|nr:glycosyl transferase, family 2 [Bacteroidia bacterium]
GNDTVQHAGVIIGLGGVAGHIHKNAPRKDPGYFGKLILPQNLSAVTAACMLMRKEVFDEVKGLNEKDLTVAFNDIDICLKIREKGYQVIWTPYAELYHLESVSRGVDTTPDKIERFKKEIEYMMITWKTDEFNDPYHNPNLSDAFETYTPAFPPRIENPW